MDVKEFKSLLSEEVKNLKEDMSTQTSEEVKKSISAFETKMTDLLAEAKKSSETVIEGQKEQIKALEASLDQLGAKLNEKTDNEARNEATLESEVKRLVKDIVKPAGGVLELEKGGQKHALNIKAVADMTLGNNFTGNQPRDYDLSPKVIPGQKLHLSDLIEAINISGGTYTFYRETGSEGAIATQTEGNTKSQIDYDLASVDVTTDYLAGFAVYSKKMANNLPFLESFLPGALRRDYLNQESSSFNTTLAAGATASTEIITGQNKLEMIIGEISKLEEANEMANGIVMRPADWYDILITEKSTGAGYGMPGVVTMDGGVLRFNGIPVFKANWLAANKYYVGDWSVVKKIVTEGLSLAFADQDASNFRQNKITARIEAQIALAIHRPVAMVYGDFTAI